MMPLPPVVSVTKPVVGSGVSAIPTKPPPEPPPPPPSVPGVVELLLQAASSAAAPAKVSTKVFDSVLMDRPRVDAVDLCERTPSIGAKTHSHLGESRCSIFSDPCPVKAGMAATALGFRLIP